MKRLSVSQSFYTTGLQSSRKSVQDTNLECNLPTEMSKGKHRLKHLSCNTCDWGWGVSSFGYKKQDRRHHSRSLYQLRRKLETWRKSLISPRLHYQYKCFHLGLCTLLQYTLLDSCKLPQLLFCWQKMFFADQSAVTIRAAHTACLQSASLGGVSTRKKKKIPFCISVTLLIFFLAKRF